ncbi:50S ribosomal protein L6 [Patescibacteria group bacterium]|nr:50S ribosomal protein L6 [Patescibacteria group bacterium]
MSRIGIQPITLPSGVQVATTSGLATVTGPKGSLVVPLYNGIELKTAESSLTVLQPDTAQRNLFGLQRTLLQNAVTGVSRGWDKTLELNGVGMRAAVSGLGLTLSLGFSHPIQFAAPAGIAFQVSKNVVTVSGIDKQLVGETASRIRKLRKPEPYKGKGIKYTTETIRRKAGKTGKAK